MAHARIHYSRAPITEAVIDIRVKFSQNVSLAQLKAVNDGEEQRYPKTTNSFRFVGQFTTGPEIVTATQQRQIGYAFRDANEKQIYQASYEGFSFSRLAPYEHWDAFRDEARRLWGRYHQQVQIQQITRIGLRYVNRFDLPMSKQDIKEFLRTFPEVSPDLPQAIAHYFMRVQSRLQTPDAILVLTETNLPQEKSELQPMILDIDVFREGEIPGDEQVLWDLFEGFRDHKNMVFEASITDQIRERIR